MKTNGAKPDWRLEPGGPVTEATAEAIKQHPQVRGSEDALFQGMHQSWSIQSSQGKRRS
jgi:hypothetical protein